jgi:hypothetical protein
MGAVKEGGTQMAVKMNFFIKEQKALNAAEAPPTVLGSTNQEELSVCSVWAWHRKHSVEVITLHWMCSSKGCTPGLSM